MDTTVIPDESKRDDPVHKDEKILIVNIYENRDYSTLADVTEPLKRMRAAVGEAAKAYPGISGEHHGATGAGG